MNPLPAVVLFSYPRCGGTWLRYVIEVLTGRPTVGAAESFHRDSPICDRVAGLPVDRGAPPAAFKRHLLSELEPEDETLSLLVAVRNYKECIVRNHIQHADRGYRFEESRAVYMAPVACFDRRPGEKLLLYYEELIAEPEAALRGVAGLLGVAGETCDRFLARYEEHRLRSLSAYDERCGSHTWGSAVAHHARRLTREERHGWDAGIRDLAPEVFDRYLSRYREPREPDLVASAAFPPTRRVRLRRARG
jgi:hypothetical protein